MGLTLLTLCAPAPLLIAGGRILALVCPEMAR
jgi:hypothetical protein